MLQSKWPLCVGGQLAAKIKSRILDLQVPDCIFQKERWDTTINHMNDSTKLRQHQVQVAAFDFFYESREI